MAWWLDLRRVFRLRLNWRFHVCNNVQNNQICRCYRRKKWAKSKTWSQDVSIAYVLCLDSKGNTGLRLDTFVRYCTVVNCCWALGWSNKLQIFLKFSFANWRHFCVTAASVYATWRHRCTDFYVPSLIRRLYIAYYALQTSWYLGII